MITMKRYALLFLCVYLTVPVFAQDEAKQREEFYAAAEHFEKLGKLFRQTTERAAPSIVTIRVKQDRTVGRNRQTRMTVEESGSGIIATIAQKQMILTNRHVLEEAEPNAITILTHDRKILTPVKIASNEDFDLAVIEVAEKLPQSANFGDSDKVQIGEIVLALGNPLGLDRSLSMGVISAVGRRNVPRATGTAPRTGFLQTDAAVNPGSSGGMLLNLQGETIGVLTAIATQGGGHEGIAFVMPINAVLRIAEQLVQTGTVVKPHIGFGFESTITLDERRKLGIDRLIGAKVRSIDPDTPAEKAGLKVGDVVLQFGNTEVEDGIHVIHLVAQSAIGKPVTLQINRDKKILNITVTPSTQLSR